jgi:hypothetical protein
MRPIRISLFALGLWYGVGPAWAQPIAPPTGAGGGIFGSRRGAATAASGSELTLTMNLGGGHDDNPEAVFDDQPVPVADQSGRIATLAGNLLFRTGSLDNSLELAGGGYTNYATVGVEQISGGDGSVQWTKTMGRRHGLLMRFNATYQPTFLFNAYGPIAEPATEGVEGVELVELPSTAPTRGITDQRWLALQAQAGVYRMWSPRQRGDVRYLRSQQEPLTGTGFDSWAQSVGYTHTWNRTERLAFRPAYHFRQNRQSDETGLELPLDSHATGLEFTYTKRLSPSRLFTLTGGVGYTYSRYHLPTGLEDFNLPTYAGGARIGVGSDWSLSLDAGRDVTLLEGLSPEPFGANSVSVRADGLAGRRTQFLVSVGYSEGAGLVTENGAFETIVGAAQMQFALGRRWALYAGYSHYRYTLDALINPASIPTRYQLNAFRIGLNLWLPLYGQL